MCVVVVLVFSNSHSTITRIGAFVLIESVRATGDVSTPFLVLYTSKVLFTEVEVSLFKAMGAILRQIEPMKGPTSHLAKARLSNNFTQLRLWQQTDFDVIVFMDADSVVLKNIEHAFGLVTMFPQWQFAAAADSLAAQVETLSGARREDEVSSFILNAGFEILRPCDATFRDLQALVESQEAEDLQVRYTQWIWEYYWGNYMLILPYTYGGSAFKAERAVPLSQRYHIHYYSSNSKPWETDGQTTDPSCSCIHPSLKVWHEFKDQFLHRADKLGLFYQ